MNTPFPRVFHRLICKAVKRRVPYKIRKTAENVCRSFRYFNAASDNKKLVSVIKKQKADIICINDANTTIDFERAKTQISTAFSALFPEPSSFEKGQ